MLILGAGLVGRPIVRYFLDAVGYELTVASLDLEDAETLVDNHPRGAARAVDVCDERQVEPLIGESDLVVSLVPYAFHVQVARLAIRNGVSMVTTSYVSPQMRAMDDEAREVGVLILNEVGLDPGIDHMSAMRMIHRIREQGGAITGFSSCTGGLPAPAAANNPWGYKFSWSPRGALLAGTQSARYMKDGRVYNVPGASLFGRCWPYEVEGLGRFEVYPNRDSMHYARLYELHHARDMMRGTIRYPGWCETMKALSDLGLLDVEERDWPPGTTYAEFLGRHLPSATAPLVERLAARLGLPTGHAIVERIAWSGLLSDEPLPETRASALDVVAGLFQRKMAYADGEQDMVVMEHRIEARWPDGRGRRFRSSLVSYGEPGGHSATSRTVSLPAAIASRMILGGELLLTGVRIPTMPEIYRPLLHELDQLGIRFEERSEPLP